jgi:predicted AAA+ superfamily ATPase
LFDRNKPELLVQACYNFTDSDTRKREIDGIMEASVFFNCKNLLILTFDHEEELKINNLNIRIIPGWKEMLAPNV